ncbi:hypothetical protein IAU59_007472 [Kwoniella sp. CBS 9459]
MPVDVPQIHTARHGESDPTTFIPSSFEEEIRLALKTFEVPGYILAIVRDGPLDVSVRLAADNTTGRYHQALGTRDLARSQPLTLQCRCSISSCPKLVHLIALDHSYQRKGYDMETSNKEMLPEFGVYDKQVEGAQTCADILSHMTGLSGHELDFEKALSVDRAQGGLYTKLPLHSLGTYRTRGMVFYV